MVLEDSVKVDGSIAGSGAADDVSTKSMMCSKRR